MKPSREQVLANRQALTDALAENRIERYLNGPDSAAAWAQFQGFSLRGARASFDLVHDMGRPRFGLTGELMPFEKLIFHVGSDASFNTYRCSWSSARAGLTESARTIERARREILSMFSPDGEATREETTAFLDAAFASVREAAHAFLEPEAAPRP